MRETKFVEQNKEKWREFERVMEAKEKDADELSDLFIQLTDDLSYARTFYPNRSVRVYLNYTAQRIYTSIYKSSKSRLSRLTAFWTRELPLVLFDARKELRTSLIVFLFAIFIGAFSAHFQPEFARVILGDNYVNMTIENIENGDPMAVYKSGTAQKVFLGITLNNIRVAFLAFILGAVFSLGTFYILMFNGIMLGSFQYFFLQRDSMTELNLFWESILAVWLHGTLEISAIVIAGAAGFLLGRGLIYPGTYSRLQSLRIWGRRAIKVFIGTVPLFIIAGFVEGFFTRYTDAPDFLRLSFILLCLGFVLFYFWWYPRQVAKTRMDDRTEEEIKLPPDTQQEISITAIKSNGDIFKESFLLFRRAMAPLMVLSAVFAVIGGTILTLYFTDHFYFRFGSTSFNPIVYFTEFFKFLKFHQLSELFFIVGGGSVFLTISAMVRFSNEIGKEGKQVSTSFLKRIPWRTVLYALLASFSINILFFIPDGSMLIFMLIFFIPVATMAMTAGIYSGSNPVVVIYQAIRTLLKAPMEALGLMSILTLVLFALCWGYSSSLFWLIFEVLSLAFNDPTTASKALLLFISITSLFGLFLVIPIISYAFSLFYFSIQERSQASGLKARITEIGISKRRYGLESE